VSTGVQVIWGGVGEEWVSRIRPPEKRPIQVMCGLLDAGGDEIVCPSQGDCPGAATLYIKLVKGRVRIRQGQMTSKHEACEFDFQVKYLFSEETAWRPEKNPKSQR